MAIYSLQYFKVNGRAGGIRLLLDYLKVPFIDEYVDMEQWRNIKQSTPFGQVPVLKGENGFELPETVAIYRYLGEKHSAIGKTLEEKAICDAIADHAQDFTFKRTVFVKGYMTKIPEDKLLEHREEAKKFFIERLIPDLNKQLEKNDTGFLVGNKPTWVDFFVADTVENVPRWFEEIKLEDLGLIGKHQEKVFSLPGLQKRLEERKILNPPKESYKS